LLVKENVRGAESAHRRGRGQISGKGMDDLIARFKYQPDEIPKLRRLWR
jgi:hypothetical protein